MKVSYEIVVEKPDGGYEPAPNPPPPEWRERKGICSKCGEKVFVKSGPLRTFWTHGKGKTCVPKPNPVSAAISLVQYAKNKGALFEGDAEMRARYAAFSGTPLNVAMPAPEPPPEAAPEPPPAPKPVVDEERKHLEGIFGGTVERRWDGSVVVGSDARPAPEAPDPGRDESFPWDTSRNNAAPSQSKAAWAPGEKEWWKRHLAEKRSRWRHG